MCKRTCKFAWTGIRMHNAVALFLKDKDSYYNCCSHIAEEIALSKIKKPAIDETIRVWRDYFSVIN